MTPRLLLVDDDSRLASMVGDYLGRAGFEVETAGSLAGGRDLLAANNYDALVLDLMLPDGDGLDLCREVRSASKTRQLPLLMLTARGEPMDRIVGLELGADDYVPKPCTPRELVARLRAILRRVQPATDAGPLQAGALTLWPEKRRAEWKGKALDLTSIEFNILEVLMRNAGRVVGKNEISEQALGRPLARFDRSIDVHLSAIRQKLGDGSTLIRTVRGMGYHLVKE